MRPSIRCCAAKVLLIFLYAGAAAAQSASFQTPVSYPAQNGPIGMATADFNGDGKLDLAVGNAGSSSISVFLGKGDGTFTPNGSASIPNSCNAVQLVAGDFNNDGNQDLLVACSVQPVFWILPGTGKGQFGAPVQTTLSGIVLTGFAIEGVFQTVAVADFNGDGNLDVVVSVLSNVGSTAQAPLDLYLGNGDGNFQPPSVILNGISGNPTLPLNVAAADLDGDGSPDLVVNAVVESTGVKDVSNVFILHGNGDGTFQQTANLVLDEQLAGSMAVADINGDGVPDLILAGTDTIQSSDQAVTNLLVFDGTGGGNFKQGFTITVIASGFGMLSQNETGVGPAVATHADNSPVTNTNAAYPNEELVLWGTGLGPLPAGVSDASSPLGAGANIGNITVSVGGVPANVVYHGRNPSDPGLDQININIPAGVSGCYVSLVVQSGNYVSNTTTLAISPSQAQKTCSDANGISVSSLSNALSSTGSATIGTVLLTSETQASGSTAGATAEFEKYTQLQLNETTAMVPFPSVGSCTVSISNSAKPAPVLGGSGIYAGGLTLTPPSGSVISLIPRSVFGAGTTVQRE